MYTHLKIWELGWIDRIEGRLLVLECTVTHCKHETHHDKWKVAWEVETMAIVEFLMSYYDATQFAYQSAWTLLEVRNKYAAGAKMIRLG